MGGAFVWKHIKAVTGVNLIEQGMRSLFDLPMDAGHAPAFTLEARFVIPKVTGVVESIEGMVEATKFPGIRDAVAYKKVGDHVQAAPDHFFDYIGDISATGQDYSQAMKRVLRALRAIKIRIRQANGTLVEHNAAFTHVPVDASTLIKPVPTAASKKGMLAQLWKAFLNLPASFKYYMMGSNLLAMAQEGIAIITSVYGLQQFGLTVGILSQATSLGFRIPGSLFAAKWVKKFNAKKIYMVTTALQGLLLLSLPLGAVYFGVSGFPFLVQYFFVQAVQGLIYGATRGMAESKIMPQLLGQDTKTLETGGFLWMAGVETFALATAFGLSPAVRSLLGSNAALGFFSAIMLSSLFFFSKIHLNDSEENKKPQAASAAGGKEDEAPSGVDSLSPREYIPYVMSSFLHFTVYSLFFGVFANYTFNNEFMSDKATGSYDLGSLAIGLTAAVPALIASLEAPKAGSAREDKGPGLMDRLSLKSWYGAAALVAAAYLWTGLAGWSLSNLLAAATLGAMTTVNRTKWMASYLNRLKAEHHAGVVARLNSLSTAVALVPFAFMSLGKIYGVAFMPLLTGIVVSASVVLALSYVLTRQPEQKPKKA
jgi:hypothetical protein